MSIQRELYRRRQEAEDIVGLLRRVEELLFGYASPRDDNMNMTPPEAPVGLIPEIRHISARIAGEHAAAFSIINTILKELEPDQPKPEGGRIAVLG